MSDQSKMNIMIFGFTWLGSSTESDLLKKYDNIGFVPGEFNEFRRPGMIGDHLADRVDQYYLSRIDYYILRKTRKQSE